MPPKLPPLSELDHLKTKADMIAQIYFCGQIVGATDIECQDALLCEMTLDAGPYWELLYPSKEKAYQTQTAYADNGEMFVWSHPFDFHYKVTQLSQWPKIILKMWRFNDSSSTNDLMAYGVTYLPKSSGFHEIQCEMWTPYGDWKFGALSFYTNSAPRLNNLHILSKELGKRKKIFSQPCGKVLIEVQTIRKNFKNLHISQ